jgi:hypothetical protein
MDRKKLEYFKRGKFLQGKRAVRQEKRRIMREAAVRHQEGLEPEARPKRPPPKPAGAEVC